MKYVVRGDKLVVTDTIRDYITNKIGRLDKYLKNFDTINATVIVKVKGKNQIVEVTIPTNKFILRAEESHNDLYAAIDLVSDKLERQIRKNKTRIKGKKYKDITYNNDIEEPDNTVVVKRKILDMKPMDEDEAILEMNLLSHDFFVYKDSHNNHTCVLYRRNDGNYGIIETK